MAGWQLDDCTLHALKGLPWRGGGRGGERGRFSRVRRRHRPFRIPCAARNSAAPKDRNSPEVEGCISLSDIERGEAHTAGQRTPLSALGAPAHFTLTIHFPDTERLFLLFHSFS